MTSFIVTNSNAKEDAVVAAYDAAISELATKGPSEAELARIRSKMRSDWYEQLEQPISRASILSHAVLFDGNADSVNTLPQKIATVTAADVRAFAAKYLVKTNRTIIFRAPAAQGEGGQK